MLVFTYFFKIPAIIFSGFYDFFVIFYFYDDNFVVLIPFARALDRPL